MASWRTHNTRRRRRERMSAIDEIFLSWGPPGSRKKFEAWTKSLEALGYTVFTVDVADDEAFDHWGGRVSPWPDPVPGQVLEDLRAFKRTLTQDVFSYFYLTQPFPEDDA